MIENLAQVLERQGECVRLSTASPSGCARCDRGEGCGGGVFGKLIQRRLRGLLIKDPGLDLQPGQMVVLGLPSGIFLRATALIYALPLTGLLFAAGLATLANLSDLLVAGAGVSGLVFSAWLAPRLRQRYIDAQLAPRLLRRASVRDMQACQTGE